MTCAKCHLLRLREILVNCAVENKFADDLNRHEIFGPNFGRVEDVKVEGILLRLCEHLNTERPRRVGSIINCLVEILPVEVCRMKSEDETSMRPHKSRDEMTFLPGS